MIDQNQIDRLKKEAETLVLDSSNAVTKLKVSTIPKCDAFELSYLLGDIAETRGATAVLSRLFPEDKLLNTLRIEAAHMHVLGYKERDKFLSECECDKKKYQTISYLK